MVPPGLQRSAQGKKKSIGVVTLMGNDSVWMRMAGYYRAAGTAPVGQVVCRAVRSRTSLLSTVVSKKKTINNYKTASFRCLVADEKCHGCVKTYNMNDEFNWIQMYVSK